MMECNALSVWTGLDRCGEKMEWDEPDSVNLEREGRSELNRVNWTRVR